MTVIKLYSLKIGRSLNAYFEKEMIYSMSGILSVAAVIGWNLIRAVVAIVTN